MNAAIDSSYARIDIANALIAQLNTLNINLPTNPPSTQPAFQSIKLFDVEDLTDAFRYLTISEQRVCVIVMLDQQFTTKLTGGNLFVTRMQPVALLISDRRLGDREKALWGDPNDATVPGAFQLEERYVRPAVTGQLINAGGGRSNLSSIPAYVRSIFLKDSDRQDLPGRAAVMLELHCQGGALQATLGPGATI